MLYLDFYSSSDTSYVTFKSKKKKEINCIPWSNNEIMIDVILQDLTAITVNVLSDHDIYMSIYEY